MGPLYDNSQTLGPLGLVEGSTVDVSLARVLELLYLARLKVNNLHLIVHYKYWAESCSGLVGKVDRNFNSSTPTTFPTTGYVNQVDESKWEVWISKPNWRMEVKNLSRKGHHVEIINSSSTTHIVNSKIQKNQGHPKNVVDAISNWQFLDPSSLLASHEIKFVRTSNSLGRLVYEIESTPRGDRTTYPEALFWSGGDRYEIEVDAEFGILMRYAGYLNNSLFGEARMELLQDGVIPFDKFDTI